MEDFPTEWSDTPTNRARWAQMKSNESFLRRAAAVRSNPLSCHYCGRRVRLAHWSEKYTGADLATADHVVALANGGTDDDSNKVVACRACNMKKGDA
jgi:5-methylcytosine-specific restriction endonuclease McrA